MNDWKLKTPVVLIIFNRPQKTKQVFEAIRQAQPPQLFIIADGPRKDRPNDTELCKQTRLIIEGVDWDCQVATNYSDINLGCRKRIGETGLSWVFDQVEEAIILEDDCLPDPTFFRFCQELLEKYRYDERIMSICGTNLLVEWKSSIQSYHFSQFFSSWGWASWRRVWEMYDVEMKFWSHPEMQNIIKSNLSNNKYFLEYKKFFNNVYQYKTNSWAYQMLYLGFTQSCFSIIPSKNLITNIGFDFDATNTSTIKDVRSALKSYPMQFPLKEPLGVGIDKYFESQRFFKLHDRSLSAKIFRKLDKLRILK